MMTDLITMAMAGVQNTAAYIADAWNGTRYAAADKGGYALTVDTHKTGPYAVRVSAAKMPQSCYVGGGRYERIAVLELTPGYLGTIPPITTHSRAVVSVVQTWEKVFRGVSPRCAAAVAQAEAQAMADRLNADYFRRARRRSQAARRRNAERDPYVVYYFGAVPHRCELNAPSSIRCCGVKHRTSEAAQRCIAGIQADADSNTGANPNDVTRLRVNYGVYAMLSDGTTAVARNAHPDC